MEKLQRITTKPSIVMEQNKHTFTKSEHKIYEYILKNEETVLYHSLTEISEASGVAEATVLRFFRKLGYKGFQDFKFAYAQEFSGQKEHSEDETYVEKIKNNMVQAVEDSYGIVDVKTLDQCVELLHRHEDVVIFGVGSSGISAEDMQTRLMRVGKHVNVVTDPHFQVMRASSMTENTLVVAISLTGSTKDIVDSVAVAKEKGATIVALTNYVKSPLTKYADQVLLSSSKESPLDSGSLVSKMAQLFLIDLLCTGFTLHNYEDAEKVKLSITKNTARKLY
ncbi:MurR/RpiR family transcriptional regulator [Salimicrobium jeotgali]|uniref:MurR/RpiR family transcriptional regulator n=1 Tax=Salimicrobium jeotgali TaxID=1230341 RepID=UPI00215555DD|nr:MurR/RpiR family transcriptional regulator [Salimicrobium jeotgali]